MNPMRRDPCKSCGLNVEHDGKPFDVTCSFCKPLPPPTTEWRIRPKVVCTTCYFILGAAVGALLTSAVQLMH